MHRACQFVKSYESLGMRWVWQVFGDFQDFTSIADTEAIKPEVQIQDIALSGTGGIHELSEQR